MLDRVVCLNNNNKHKHYKNQHATKYTNLPNTNALMNAAESFKYEEPSIFDKVIQARDKEEVVDKYLHSHIQLTQFVAITAEFHQNTVAAWHCLHRKLATLANMCWGGMVHTVVQFHEI